MGKILDLEEYRKRKQREELSFAKFYESMLEQVARTLGIPKHLLKERGE